MLVAKTWITTCYNKKNDYGKRQELRKWKGYYLFGFIPLYISNYETIYS